MKQVSPQEQDDQSNKITLRRHWKEVRRRIPAYRRKEAAMGSLAALSYDRYTLSYAHIEDEFPTDLLNAALAKAGNLLLPKLIGRELQVYHVDDPSKQLIAGAFGILEPDPLLCYEAESASIALVLVPALAFDTRNHRLGYGLGCYDRFLPTLPSTAETYGLGFKEQLHRRDLPITPLDVPLKSLLLF